MARQYTVGTGSFSKMSGGRKTAPQTRKPKGASASAGRMKAIKRMK
jgi:hypothetical protein